MKTSAALRGFLFFFWRERWRERRVAEWQARRPMGRHRYDHGGRTRVGGVEAAAPQPFNRGGREPAGRAPPPLLPPLPLLLKGYRRRRFLAPIASTSLQLWDFGGQARSGSLPKSRWTCDGASSSERCRRWCREAGFCSSSLPAGSRAWRTSARSSDGQPAPRRREIQGLFPVALAAAASHASLGHFLAQHPRTGRSCGGGSRARAVACKS